MGPSIKKFSFVTLIVLCTFSYAPSTTLRERCENLLRRFLSLGRVSALDQRRRNHPERIVQNLIQHPPEIDHTVRPLGIPGSPEASGASNAGVYSVSTADGRRVILKFAFSSNFDRDERNDSQGTNPEQRAGFRDYVLIHSYLAELGYAPRLLGVYSNASSQREIAAFNRGQQRPVVNPTNLNVIGLVMEEINEAWNLPRQRQEAPPYVRNWSQQSVERILFRMKEIEIALNALRIHADDDQLFISREGRVVLGDLDMYRFLEPSEPANFNLSSRMFDVVTNWERQTGQNFPREILRTLTGERAVSYTQLQVYRVYESQMRRLTALLEDIRAPGSASRRNLLQSQYNDIQRGFTQLQQHSPNYRERYRAQLDALIQQIEEALTAP